MDSPLILHTMLLINKTDAWLEFKALADKSGWDVLNGRNLDNLPAMNEEVFQECLKTVVNSHIGQRHLIPHKSFDYSLDRIITSAAHEYVRSEYYTKEMERIKAALDAKQADRPQWVLENERLLEENQALKGILRKYIIGLRETHVEVHSIIKGLPKSASKTLRDSLTSLRTMLYQNNKDNESSINYHKLEMPYDSGVVELGKETD